MLTLEERERLAYAEGYTETAKLLGEMADLECARDALEDDLDKAQKLIEEHDDTSDELERAERAIDELGCKLHDTRAELELSQDKAKTYRAALMALEAEVSPAMREFIREVLA